MKRSLSFMWLARVALPRRTAGTLAEPAKAAVETCPCRDFVGEAGRYLNPGAGRAADARSFFELSETHQISASDLFGPAARAMRHAKILVDEPSSDVAPG